MMVHHWWSIFSWKKMSIFVISLKVSMNPFVITSCVCSTSVIVYDIRMFNFNKIREIKIRLKYTSFDISSHLFWWNRFGWYDVWTASYKERELEGENLFLLIISLFWLYILFLLFLFLLFLLFASLVLFRHIASESFRLIARGL